MPIYAYQCTECRHEVEVLQKMSDAPLIDCPACHRSSLVKKVTAAGFQLKGSGWYVTDFRGGGSKPKDDKAADGKPAETGVKTEAAKPAEGQSPASKPAETASAAPASTASNSGSGPTPAASS